MMLALLADRVQPAKNRNPLFYMQLVNSKALRRVIFFDFC